MEITEPLNPLELLRALQVVELCSVHFWGIVLSRYLFGCNNVDPRFSVHRQKIQTAIKLQCQFLEVDLSWVLLLKDYMLGPKMLSLQKQ